jgi:hypothetical protein
MHDHSDLDDELRYEKYREAEEDDARAESFEAEYRGITVTQIAGRPPFP